MFDLFNQNMYDHINAKNLDNGDFGQIVDLVSGNDCN